MSKFVKVQTELRDLAMIKRALDDLKIAYAEDQTYSHPWSGFRGQVPVLVEHERVTFGLRESDEGVFEALGDDMAMRRLKSVLDQVQQRYAYHKVLAEVDQAGFSLVEEQVGSDKVIRLTVRRWS